MITELTHRFDAMMASLQGVRRLILQTQPPHWLPLTQHEQSSGLKPLTLLADLITDVWYRDGQDGRETRSRHGLVLVDDTIAAAVQQANHNKDQFRTAVQQMQQELDKTAFIEQLGGLGLRHAALRESLHFSGLSRLHLKQSYRHLPLLDHAPLKAGFSWYAHGRSIRRLSVAEAQAKLLALGEDKAHIQVQLAKLNHLPAGQKLAQVQTLAPVVRANLVYADDAPRQRQAMNVALPLMMPGEVLPAFNEIPPEPPAERTRQRRGDQKVSDEPYLPSIRVHLYHD